LAHKQGSQGDNTLQERRGWDLPALLVSYYYLPAFLKARDRYHFRDWSLDSGAFSAHKSGVTIDLDKYIEDCRRLMVEDDKLVEVFALDVIGDARASLANTERMWEAGVEAIPTFHFGSPWSELEYIAKTYPKIALGGVVGQPLSVKDKWAGQCFARVWPKRIHGFGFGSEQSILAVPFHSVDATNWEMGPCAFGRWATFGKMSVRGSKQDLRREVEYYLRVERKARARWRKQMKLFDSIEGPAKRLALSGAHTADKRRAMGDQSEAPSVRLALSNNAGNRKDAFEGEDQ